MIKLGSLLALVGLLIGIVVAVMNLWNKRHVPRWLTSLKKTPGLVPMAPLTADEQPAITCGRVRIGPALKVTGRIETRDGIKEVKELMWSAVIKDAQIAKKLRFEVRAGVANGSEMDLVNGLKAEVHDGDSMDCLGSRTCTALAKLHQHAPIRVLMLVGGVLQLTARIKSCDVESAKRVAGLFDEVVRSAEALAPRARSAARTAG